jgi:hypothetical protein
MPPSQPPPPAHLNITALILFYLLLLSLYVMISLLERNFLSLPLPAEDELPMERGDTGCVSGIPGWGAFGWLFILCGLALFICEMGSVHLPQGKVRGEC